MFIDVLKSQPGQPYAYARDIRQIVLPDPYGQEDNGEECVGIRAAVTVYIPAGDRTAIIQQIETPGLWGIDAPSGHGDYGAEVYGEEVATLRDMLKALNVAVIANGEEL